MLADELRDLLRELCVATGAAAVALSRDEVEVADRAPVAQRAAVGRGATLIAWYDDGGGEGTAATRGAALARTARSLRACAARWDAADLPALAYPEQGRTTPARAHARIVAYLGALARSVGMTGAVVTHRGEVVAIGGEVDDLQRDRVSFTVRRVQLEAERGKGKTSHAEMTGADFYAVSFWYDACLVGFFPGPWSIDFVRHRARQVTRELAQLLAMMDDPTDHDPIQTAPVPEPPKA